MKLLARVFGMQKVTTVATTVIDGNEPEIVNQESYRWFTSGCKRKAELLLQEMRSAMDLGLRNQAMLTARELIVLALQDFAKGNYLRIYELHLEAGTHNYDTGLCHIEGMLNHMMMHKLDNGTVRLPRGALKTLEILRLFPQRFIQGLVVLENIKRRIPSRDSRLAEGKAFHFPTFLPASAPLLTVKVCNRWFYVYQ